MTFATSTFLVFLTIVFALYWNLDRHRAQNVLLSAARPRSDSSSGR